MPEMTERQKAAWPEAIAEAQKHVGGDEINADIQHWAWRVRWEDESRPGRGHTIRAVWCDGEYLVDISMDVYGHPSVGVAQLDWVHDSGNEECDCGCREDEPEPESHDSTTGDTDGNP